MKRQPLPAIKDCNDCGACCTQQEALPLGWYLGVTPLGNPASLPPAILEELRQLAEHFDQVGWPGNGEPCVWYDQATKQCKHYEHRPDICRDTVKVGDDSCRRWRQELGVDPSVVSRIVRGRLVRVERKPKGAASS